MTEDYDDACQSSTTTDYIHLGDLFVFEIVRHR